MIKLKKLLIESPDTVHLYDDNNREINLLHYRDEDSIGFLFDKTGNFHVTDYGQSHVDIPIEGASKYEGRIWETNKIVSFWEYPKNPRQFRGIAKLLKDETDIDILQKDWKIEIKEKKTFAPKFIPTREYGKVVDKIVNPSQAEYQKHLDRMKTDIPKGWGSKKRPADMTATQHQQMKMTSDGVIKLKSLVESPDSMFVPHFGNYTDYEDNDAYPFYFIDNKLYISDNAGYTHGDSILRSGKYSKKVVDYILNNKASYGRIWVKRDAISFWSYPDDRKEMRDLADALTKHFSDNGININVWGDFNVEIYDEYGNEYDVEDEEIGVIPVKNYKGSDSPPEEERLQHLLSPAQKKNLNIPSGWGSKKRPADLTTTQRHQMKSTSDGIIKLKKLVESPDNIFMSNLEYSIEYDSDDAYAFYYIENKLYIADRPGMTHGEIPMDREAKHIFYGTKLVNPYGRVWIDTGVMSFWEYPDDRKVMRSIADDISEHFRLAHNINIKVWEDFQVEVNHDGAFNTSRSGLIPVKSYKGSDSPSEEERLQHLLSPAQKKNVDVTPGWGSKKTPAGLSNTQRHQMKSTSEGEV